MLHDFVLAVAAAAAPTIISTQIAVGACESRVRAREHTHFRMVLQHCCGPATTMSCFCFLKWPVTRVDIKIGVNTHDRQHTILARSESNRKTGKCNCD